MTSVAEAAQLIQKRLVTLGVPATAAKLYAHLLQAGPEKISDAAASLDISRDQTYRNFAQLSDRGFASATLTWPMMCVPTDPDQVLKIMWRRCDRSMRAAKESRDLLLPLLDRLKSAADWNQRMPFRILNGRDKAHDLLHEMLSGATDEMLVLNSHPAAAHLAEQADLWRRVQQRADVGLQIRILLADVPGVRRHTQKVDSPNCEVRLMELDEGLRFAIVDRCDMLFFASMDPSPWLPAQDTAIRTQAVDFVNTERALFWSLWEEAEPA